MGEAKKFLKLFLLRQSWFGNKNKKKFANSTYWGYFEVKKLLSWQIRLSWQKNL